MTTSLDEDKAPRMAPALCAIRDLLCDMEWHPHDELIEVADDASDLALDTVRARICEAVAVGFVEKRGTYLPQRRLSDGRVQRARDSREYRLIDWPLPW